MDGVGKLAGTILEFCHLPDRARVDAEHVAIAAMRSRLQRRIKAKNVDDLDAFNEDGRVRAIRLGFPPDSWVVKKEEIDYRSWRQIVAALGPED